MASTLPTPLGTPTCGSAEPPCLFFRERLEAELVPKDPTVPEHKRFFPYGRVALILDDESIEEVLHCWCPKCHTFREFSGIQTESLIAGITGGESESASGPQGGAVHLFALLIYIGCPLLIDSFLRLNIGDDKLRDSTATFNAAFVQKIMGSDAHQRFPQLAQRFHWRKYQFFVPEIHDAEYMEYPENTILPFVNEVVLGHPSATGNVVAEGGHGKVYAFEISEGYGGFKEFPGARRFARKELYANTPEYRFTAERTNLFAVKKLQDEHLVKILSAYKLGDVYNLVFPLAEANLHRYLRDPQYRAFRGARCIVGHSVWKQLLGLAEGLYKVQHFHEDVISSTDSKFGYHFDLKPANILVEEGERLIITDFGQSFFKAANDVTDSRVSGMGGTEAYAPPELNDQSLGLNRRYDIWSLGCIFLEVLVYVLTGTDGLLELDRSRVSKGLAIRHIDDKFYGYDSLSGTCSLKSGILDQIETLSRHLHDAAEKDFFQKFLDLVLHMLDVNPKTRFTSKNVFIYLSSILNPPRPRNNSDSSCATFLSTSSGIPVGNELITSFHTMSFRIENSWRYGAFQIIQDGTKLYVQTSSGNDSDRVLLGPRSSLRLIPDYALHNATSYHFVDTALSISPEDGRIASTRKCTFDCGQDLDATCCLQEVFLGQEVVQSFKIQTAKLSPYQKKLSTQGIRRSLRRLKRESDFDDLGQASAIQLWQESSDADAVGMFESADSSKRRYFPNPSHRRIVIFYGQAILVLRMAKNFRLNIAPSSVSDSQCVLQLVPTAENIDRSFSASLLRKQFDNSPPSFSLVREAFQSEEENGRLECTSLAVTFHTSQEARLFYDSYKNVKQVWREEMKSFDIARGRHGTGHFDFKRQ
ncbi:hypothetical protein N0V90_001683 [Kalmusia sp. IMI 367209]|nr:hypothetical protein N0V90_001683 [Kalmusia sp. IMI 367209]